MRKNKFFYLALLIPVVVLLSMTAKPVLTTYFGQEVKLQTVPYDPRDLFYGDYVDLDFEIERIPYELLSGSLTESFTLENGDYLHYEGNEHDLHVYITLERDNEGIYKAISVSKEVPVTMQHTYIKAVLHTYTSGDGNLILDIPIERYYLPENTGKQLEEDAREGRLIATIKLYKGYPILKSVEKNE